MKNILLLILCCSFLLIGQSCEKSPNPVPDPPYNPVNDLPDAHNTSAESVFACLVNGEVWKPSWGFNNPAYSFHEPTGGLSISAQKNTSDNFQSIGFAVNFANEGIYPLKNPGYVNKNYCIDYPQYEFDTLSPFQTNIEYFSSDEGIIIGTFEFTAFNHGCNKMDTVRITDGRFKVTY